MNLTHSALVKIAEKWLLKRCGFAFSELVTLAGETPDSIGFRSGSSILIECKANRTDFFADKKKIFRKNPWMGVGAFRFFLCPKNLIRQDELPFMWGLIEVNDKGVARKKIGPKGNIWNGNNEWCFERNIENEMALMYSALRRLHLRGVIPLIYDNPYKGV